MGGKSQQSSSQVSIPPEVLARYNAVNAQAQQVAQNQFQVYSTNPSDFVAQMTPEQQAGTAQTVAYSQAAQPWIQQAGQYTAAGASGVAPTDLNGQAIAKYMSPYMQGVVAPTAQLMEQQFNQAQMDQLGNAIKSGSYGGDRAGIAAANLQQQQGLAFGKTMGDLLNQNYGQALSTAQQQQGVNLGAQQFNSQQDMAAGAQMGNLGNEAQTAGLAGAQAMMGAGQQAQQTQQAGLTALYNQFLQQQSYPFQTTQFLANIAEGTGALSGQTTSTTSPAPFFSDRRLKENIREVGKAKNGLPIYSFSYKGDPDKLIRLGFMADDVEKKHPDAVGLAGGYKTVDYERAARASGGGLVADNDYRRGFDGGGYAGLYDPSWASIDQHEANMFGQSSGQAGLDPYGGAGRHVPKTPESHRQLPPAPQPPHQQQGAGAQALQGLNQLEQLGKSAQGVGKMGSDAMHATGLAGAPAPHDAPVAPPTDHPAATGGGSPTTSAAPASDGSTPHAALDGNSDSLQNVADSGVDPSLGDSSDVGADAGSQLADAGADMGGVGADFGDIGAAFAAHGGRIGRDAGGGLGAAAMPGAGFSPNDPTPAAASYNAQLRQQAMPTWNGPFARGGRAGLAGGGAPAPAAASSSPAPMSTTLTDPAQIQENAAYQGFPFNSMFDPFKDQAFQGSPFYNPGPSQQQKYDPEALTGPTLLPPSKMHSGSQYSDPAGLDNLQGLTFNPALPPGASPNTTASNWTPSSAPFLPSGLNPDRPFQAHGTPNYSLTPDLGGFGADAQTALMQGGPYAGQTMMGYYYGDMGAYAGNQNGQYALARGGLAGGRKHFDAGGAGSSNSSGMSDAGDPEGIYASGDDLDIPNQPSDAHLPNPPQDKSGSGGGGGFNPMSAIGPLLGLLALKDGGRAHRAGGGLLDDITIPDPPSPDDGSGQAPDDPPVVMGGAGRDDRATGLDPGYLGGLSNDYVGGDRMPGAAPMGPTGFHSMPSHASSTPDLPSAWDQTDHGVPHESGPEGGLRGLAAGERAATPNNYGDPLTDPFAPWSSAPGGIGGDTVRELAPSGGFTPSASKPAAAPAPSPAPKPAPRTMQASSSGLAGGSPALMMAGAPEDARQVQTAQGPQWRTGSDLPSAGGLAGRAQRAVGNTASAINQRVTQAGQAVAHGIDSARDYAAAAPGQVRQVIDSIVPESMRPYAYAMAQHESRMGRDMTSPTGAKGLFQFTAGTGADYGLNGRGFDNRMDNVANTKAFVQLTQQNAAGLERALGRPPTWSELALAHQQGLQGATNILTGHGNVSQHNLAVNNLGGVPRDQIAGRVASFYGVPNTSWRADAAPNPDRWGDTPETMAAPKLSAAETIARRQAHGDTSHADPSKWGDASAAGFVPPGLHRTAGGSYRDFRGQGPYGEGSTFYAGDKAWTLQNGQWVQASATGGLVGKKVANG